MLFNEIYSAYYNAVAKILTAVLNGQTDSRVLQKIVSDTAFGESLLTVLPSLKSGKWQLLSEEMKTAIKNPPTMPLTNIQKQWLKAVSLDKRVRLFDMDFSFLDDVPPLFTDEDYIIYDKYSDGDPYADENYVERFRLILSAIREKKWLDISMSTKSGGVKSYTVFPKKLEYSEKDDKFRLLTLGNHHVSQINLGRIISCSVCQRDKECEIEAKPQNKKSVTLKITNERNALERCLLHFAHFKKRVERGEENAYFVYINYNESDETELVIRVLSFGPMVEVIEPSEFRNLIIDRLKRQKSCELF